MELTANQTVAVRWLAEHRKDVLFQRTTIIKENGLTEDEYDSLISYLAVCHDILEISARVLASLADRGGGVYQAVI